MIGCRHNGQFFLSATDHWWTSPTKLPSSFPFFVSIRRLMEPALHTLYMRSAGWWWVTSMVITLMGRIRAWSSAAYLELEQGK